MTGDGLTKDEKAKITKADCLWLRAGERLSLSVLKDGTVVARVKVEGLSLDLVPRRRRMPQHPTKPQGRRPAF